MSKCFGISHLTNYNVLTALVSVLTRTTSIRPKKLETVVITDPELLNGNGIVLVDDGNDLLRSFLEVGCNQLTRGSKEREQWINLIMTPYTAIERFLDCSSQSRLGNVAMLCELFIFQSCILTIICLHQKKFLK